MHEYVFVLGSTDGGPDFGGSSLCHAAVASSTTEARVWVERRTENEGRSDDTAHMQHTVTVFSVTPPWDRSRHCFKS